MNHGAEARMAELVDKVKLCHNMDEVRALMGEPYEVYRYLPPKLGQDLVEKGDAAESVVFYAFTVQKMPPLFVVVKASTKEGKVLKVGAASS
jgi:hypothetical protein